MKSRPVAAFGTVIFMVTAEAGEIIDVPLGAGGIYTPGFYYFLNGEVTPRVLQTGEVLERRTRGWLNSERTNSIIPFSTATTSGTLRMEYLVESTWVCIPYVMNHGKSLPKLVSAEHPMNTAIQFYQGEDVFLADGELKIGEKEFIAPAQIRIRSGNVIGTAVKDCLTLKFEK